MSVGASMRCPEAHKDDVLCDIAQALGRSENSVRNMLMRKGYLQRTRHAHGWTEAEDDYLYKRYGRTSAAEIGKRLGRTEESVKHRAAALGLRAYDEYISLKELGRVFGIDLRAIHRWIALYDMPAVGTTGASMQAPSGSGQKRIRRSSRGTTTTAAFRMSLHGRRRRSRAIMRSIIGPR